LNNVFEIFPNLQIILTTHSPFIVSSVPQAKIFVCVPGADQSKVVDETDEYANKPIDEILLTPLFKTQPFNTEISNLIQQRKKAIQENDDKLKETIEQKLINLNPEYFNYFEIDKLLKK
jgi:predicted ATP-binding protein involved in virulence